MKLQRHTLITLLFISVTLLSLTGLWFFSQKPETLFEKYHSMISDDAVEPYIQDALKRIHTAQCKKNVPCPKATPEEFANPPVSIEEGRFAMTHGIISALTQWCGLDWKRSFLPMIVYGKKQKQINTRSLHLMSLIHGHFQARQFRIYKKSGTCPDKLKRNLDTKLPKLSSKR